MIRRLNYYLQKKRRNFFNRIRTKDGKLGRCCICITNETILFAYVDEVANKKELRLVKVIPYNSADRLSSVVGSVVHQYGLKNVECTLLIHPAHYQLLHMDSLPVADSEFQAAIRWKIKSLINFPLDDAIIDHYPIPEQKTPGLTKMMTVVVSKASYLRPLANEILESGLKLDTIDIFEMALRNITALYETDEKTSALIYLRKNRSTILITRQKTLYLQRQIDADLDLNDIALELQRSFDYYQSQWREPPPTRIFLVTSHAELGPSLEFFKNEIGVNLQPLDLGNVIASSEELTEKLQGRCLPVIGGALRAEGNDATTS